MMTQLLFVQATAPPGSIIGQEGLDACLMGSAFADCAVLFLDDGIYQIVTPQDTSKIGVKDYSVSYGALRDFGVNKIYCRTSDLAQRGIAKEQLVIAVECLSDSEAEILVRDSQQVLTF